jgi:hypothetical protein
MSASNRHAPVVKICLPRPAPEMFAKFAKFANFEGSYLSLGAKRSMARLVTHPGSSGESPLLHLGQDDTVRGAHAARRMPGSEELIRDLRSNEPEPLTGMRNLSRL